MRFYDPSNVAADNAPLLGTSSLVQSGASTTSRDWHSDRWTGDDSSYALARRSIDRLFKVGMDPQLIVNRYRAIAVAHPTSPLDAFQYAYASSKQRLIPHAVWQSSYPIIEPLIAIDPGNSYNCTRLIFLFEGGTRQDIEVGKRLYEVDPTDWEVGYIYALSLSNATSYDESKAAEQIIESIVQNHPDSAIAYDTGGWIYADIGYTAKNPLFYKKSIAYFQTFFSLTPSYDCYRSDHMHCIAVLQLRLKAMGAQ